VIKKLFTCILTAILFQQFTLGQIETYTVTLSKFSSRKYDEFSPVYYKKGIVFCTNRSPNLFLNYSSSQNKRQFKIYYIDTTRKVNSRSARLFSKNLKTKLNDGPVTFNNRGDTIYYSRNLDLSNKLSKISSPRNKLGIFSAVLVDGKWTKIREFRYNNEMYNITSPCLSPDGKRLFFASDKPGGFGGSDLYYCQWRGNYWSVPVNLGPVINTAGNESYPFIDPSGDLFFSSDGHPGLGGKDIFFSQLSDSSWLTPVHLDPPINSKYDDFGIITDTLMNEGYFSSNRNKSIDIYHFKTNFPQIFYSSIQKENQYCFMFNDNGSIVIDTGKLEYKWSFGDGNSSGKAVVSHCFIGPGNYDIKLDIIERVTGKPFFSKLSYNLEIRDIEQPYINSSDVAVKGDIIEIDGLKSYLPGYKILTYSWDFGDGYRSSGKSVRHSYQKKGEYIVNMGLTLKSGSTGNINKTGISKKILVLNDLTEKASVLDKKASEKIALPDIKNFENSKIGIHYSAETEFKQEAVFVIELFSSKNKIGPNNIIFRNIPKKYTIREKYNPVAGMYSYVVDQQMSLMATYPAYKEILALGFRDARIKMYVLKDPAEKELHNLIKINGAFADSYFDTSGKLTSNAYIMLDQIVKLLKKYTSMKLEVAVHTDNTVSAEYNLAVSQRHSQDLVKYLIMRGINIKRLVATGFGGSKPIAPNFLEKDRKLNRRIDFIIL
jgi:outer membrane protein OmpA-like peptidoglycan-associated protein